MPRDTPAARRIMDVYADANRLPIINLEEGDLYVLGGAPVAGLLISGLAEIDALVLPLVTLGALFGIAAVYAAPSHLSAATWLEDVSRYYVTRPALTLSREASSDDVTTDDRLPYRPFAVDETTEELTKFKRAWPAASAVERTDGTVVGLLELHPGNMDFAMSGDWAGMQEVGEHFANNELNFPLAVHTTTRPFPVERLIEKVESRLDADDVTQNETLTTLLEEYREKRPREMEGTQQLHHFLCLEVAPREVYTRYDEEPTPAGRLARVPVLGLLLRPFVTRRDRLTEGEVRTKLFDTLDRRCRIVETELIAKTNGWGSRRLSTTECYVRLLDFWNGTEHEFGDDTTVVRSGMALQSEVSDE